MNHPNNVNAQAPRRFRAKKADHAPLAPEVDHNPCEGGPLEGFYRCDQCEGRDGAMHFHIDPLEGVCVDRQCYNRARLREWLQGDLNRRVPHNRRPLLFWEQPIIMGYGALPAAPEGGCTAPPNAAAAGGGGGGGGGGGRECPGCRPGSGGSHDEVCEGCGRGGGGGGGGGANGGGGGGGGGGGDGGGWQVDPRTGNQFRVVIDPHDAHIRQLAARAGTPPRRVRRRNRVRRRTPFQGREYFTQRFPRWPGVGGRRRKRKTRKYKKRRRGQRRKTPRRKRRRTRCRHRKR